jgi:hypothetical protein
MLTFDLNKVIQICTPWAKRKPRFLTWAGIFISHLVVIKNALYVYWQKTIDEVMMTPQIAYLEHFLNRLFSRTDIFITDGYELGPWIFSNTETPDPEFYMDTDDQSFVYSNQDTVTVDFIVNIPYAIIGDVQLIAAIVNKYKLPGKYFIIQIFH